MSADVMSPEVTRRTRGPSPQKTERTRAALVEAAMAEFLDRGYAAATMAGVAARAGLAKGTPYRYFATKEDLFSAIVRDIVTGPLTAAAHEPFLEGESVAAYCRRTLLPVMDRIEPSGRATVARLVLVDGRDFPHLVEVYRDEVYRPFLEQLGRLVEIARSRGELSDDGLADVPHLLAAPLWVGIVNNGILDPARPVDAGRLFEAQLRLFFR